ncbi:MAG: site-specific integrase [Flavobacteriales bacterium]|jgi:integrase|nr:site-specific integrase [Flavobacteriales bacterium]
MATMFVTRLQKIDSVKQKDGRYPIVLQVTFNRKVRRKRTGLNALIEQWDFTNHEFKKGVHGRRELNKKLEDIQKKAIKIYEKHFEDKPFDYKVFLELFEEKPIEKRGVSAFCMEVSKGFIKTGQIHSANYYKHTASAVLKVAPKDLPFEDFTEDWLRKFEEYHISKGTKCHNYMVHLRSVFNKAVQKKLADFNRNPFKNPYTNPYGYDFSHLKKLKLKKTKRIKDLDREQLIKLKNFDNMTEKERKYMAIWFFSFYCFGVNLIDIARMKYKHIKNDRWYYDRNKTGTGLKNGKPLIDEALNIIQKFGTSGLKGKKDDYVFDILVGYDENEESINKRVNYYANFIRNACKRVATRMGFDGHFSYYSARYSSATLALNEGADRNTVSHLLDHENFSTIDNYAGRADDSKVLKAMEILKLT